jgi:hypothetical protein
MGRKGQSSLFDAILFFLVLTSASIFMYVVPGSLMSQNEELRVSEYRREFVDGTLSAVLGSTIRSTSFVKDRTEHLVFDIDTRQAIQLYMELKYEMIEGSLCNLTELRRDIDNSFKTAVPPEFEFSVDVRYVKGSIIIEETVSGQDPPKVTKYSSVFEASTGDFEFSIVLSIW